MKKRLLVGTLGMAFCLTMLPLPVAAEAGGFVSEKPAENPEALILEEPETLIPGDSELFGEESGELLDEETPDAFYEEVPEDEGEENPGFLPEELQEEAAEEAVEETAEETADPAGASGLSEDKASGDALIDGGDIGTEPEPAEITGLYNSQNGGDLRWEASLEADKYVIYRTNAGKTIKLATVEGTVTSYMDTSIKNDCWGKVYVYYVCSQIGTDISARGEGKTLQRLAPMNITSLTSAKANTARITWAVSTGTNKANGYEVQYAASREDLFNQKGSFRKSGVDGRNNLSREISGLTAGATYYFRVRAYVNYTHSVTKVTTKTWSQYSGVSSVTIPDVKVSDSVVRIGNIPVPDGGEVSLLLEAGKFYAIAVTGAGMTNTSPVQGSVRYKPAYWVQVKRDGSIGTRQIAWRIGSTVTIRSGSRIPIRIYYERQVFSSGNWVTDSSEPYTSHTVVAK